MASLSMKERLAAMKAKLEQSTSTSNPSSTTQSTTVSPPPPSTTSVNPVPQQQQQSAATTEVNTNNNNNTASNTKEGNAPQEEEEKTKNMITPHFVQKHFPSHIYSKIDPTLEKHTHEHRAAVGLAQAQYLTSLMTRVSQLETTPEGNRPSAKSFVQNLVAATTTTSTSSTSIGGGELNLPNETIGQRRQREENLTTSTIPTSLDYFNSNNNNQKLSIDGQKIKKKQDIGFLGATPSQRKCEDVEEKYDTGTAISEGVFGVVYRGTSKKNGHHFALKKIKDNWFTESREGFPHYLLRELDLCLRLKHDYTMEGVEVASNRPTEKEYLLLANDEDDDGNDGKLQQKSQLHEDSSSSSTSKTSTSSSSKSSMKSLFIGDLCSEVAPPTPGVRPSLFLVTEYGGRNLRHEIVRLSRPFDMAAVKHIMIQILEGMNYLHKNFIIHRDLKPSNILVNDAGTVKICDFGLARSIKTINNTNRRQLSTNVVTLFYRAPELHFGASDYHAAIDVWSVGCIFAELLTGVPLFVAHEDNLHLQEVCRVIGIPTEESFPGFTLFHNAVKALSTVTVNADDVEIVHQKHKADPTKGGLVRSHLLERRIRSERAKLFSADEAGEKLQQDPKYCVTDSCMELLDMMLQWSPKVRITCEEALKHPFFTEEGTPAAAAFDIEQRRQYSRFLQQQQQMEGK